MTNFLDIISRILSILTWIFGLLFYVYVFNPTFYGSQPNETIYKLFVSFVYFIAGFLLGRFGL